LFKISQFEQRANIQFYFKLGRTAAKTLEYLNTVYGDEALKKTIVYDWYKRLKNGPVLLEDEERSGRPSSSKNEETVEKVQHLVRSNRRLRFQDMANIRICISAAVCPSLKQNLMLARCSNCDILNKCVNFVAYRHDYDKRKINVVTTIKPTDSKLRILFIPIFRYVIRKIVFIFYK